MTVRVLTGDCREILATLPDESVHCVITSPPYWGLRDYHVEPSVWGGVAACPHEWEDESGYQGHRGNRGQVPQTKHPAHIDYPQNTGQKQATCGVCGAWRGVLGLEPTPELHVEHIVEIFREVRRVLRKDGTLWLNYGDCYAGSPNGRSAAAVKALGNDDRTFRDKPFGTAVGGLKPKDLVMMPARIALALQADGWWLRSEIVWAKPNPMPESITDRPTSSHEKMFLLTRSARYFYDAEAVRVPLARSWDAVINGPVGRNNSSVAQSGVPEPNPNGANLRNVWHIATHPYPDAHFATFPPALVEPCIKAGTSEKGVCGACGAPWVRDVEMTEEYAKLLASGKAWRDNTGKPDSFTNRQPSDHPATVPTKHRTTGWSPSCKCAADTVSAVVLDVFGGSGTVGLVADRLGRDAILIELNPEYADMARARITQDSPLFAEVGP